MVGAGGRGNPGLWTLAEGTEGEDWNLQIQF